MFCTVVARKDIDYIADDLRSKLYLSYWVNGDVCAVFVIRVVLWTLFIGEVTRSSASSKQAGVSPSSGGDVASRRATEAETRRREIAAAEMRRRRWQDSRQRSDDDSFNRPDTPPEAPSRPSPPARFSLPTDSVILRHRRRCRAAMVTPHSSSSSSGDSSSSSSSSSAGDGDDEDDDRRTNRHHRVLSRGRYAVRAKRASDSSSRLVQLQNKILTPATKLQCVVSVLLVVWHSG